MTDSWQELLDRFRLSEHGFAQRLAAVRPEQWSAPTPCTDWTVRQLVNHVVRGNLNYVRLMHGGSSADFLRLRDADALGADPIGAHARGVRLLADTFGAPDAADRVLDYPLGEIPGRQALAIRLTDTAVHTWDLARAIGADDRLDAALVEWISSNLAETYKDLPGTPGTDVATHRFFAPPRTAAGGRESEQDRLLRLMGRDPQRPA